MPSSQTAAFRQLVCDHLRGAAVVVPAGTPCLEAVETWLVARHGQRTPAQVRADQRWVDRPFVTELPLAA